MNWVSLANTKSLAAKGSLMIKHEAKQLALFQAGDRVYAIDNRCPHEGYPLKEGALDADACVLTCQWHNWKFDLKTGKCLVGEDHVRTYPVRLVGEDIQVDLADPDPELQRANIMAGLMEACAKNQYGRIARELARLESSGLGGIAAVKQVLIAVHDKLEYGMTHAWPATADWLVLYGEAKDDLEQRVICLTEAIDHLAWDTLREPVYPYAERLIPFDGMQLLAAIEQEDEPRAIGMLRSAVSMGLGWNELEPWLCQAALAHYLDFGHSLIYIVKTRQLLEILGEDLLLPVLLPLIRAIIYGTREDKIPDFKHYEPQLAQKPERFGLGQLPDGYSDPYGHSVLKTLKWTADALRIAAPEAVHGALLTASAQHMLAFDEDFQNAFHRPVQHNINWLSFTHALTFGNALRHTCARYPELWWPGLLQMACFLGRNTPYLLPDMHFAYAGLIERPDFFAEVVAKITDHGIREPIFSCHLLKTSLAVREELEFLDADQGDLLLQALNRFLNARLKPKHVRRTVRQALSLIKGK